MIRREVAKVPHGYIRCCACGAIVKMDEATVRVAKASGTRSTNVWEAEYFHPECAPAPANKVSQLT